MFERRAHRDSCGGIWSVVRAVKVEDSGTGLSGDENARAGVPGLISENYACIQSALSGPCKINSRSTEHAYALSMRSKVVNESTACLVRGFCAGAEGVLVYRYECGVERLSSAHVESLTVGVGTAFDQCMVLHSKEWHIDDGKKGYVVLHETEGYGAEWQSVKKVDGAVDGIEYPPRPISRIGPAALFAEESDVWRVLTKKSRTSCSTAVSTSVVRSRSPFDVSVWGT
jgi:hypothetical protein